jgi:cephalosporin hydroxylase
MTVAEQLAVHIDIAASWAALDAGEHDHDGMLKLRQDLDRYHTIIAATDPDVIVETGTRTGATARWFAAEGPDVITIDVNPTIFEGPDDDGVTRVVGDSADPWVVARVAGLVAGRRCMVSLDSDHDAAHVRREILAYGPLVSFGCHLVVEDAIWGYADEATRLRQGEGGMQGSPLDAICQLLAGNPAWSRDVTVERRHPVSHNPAGWWVRVDAAVTPWH